MEKDVELELFSLQVRHCVLRGAFTVTAKSTLLPLPTADASQSYACLRNPETIRSGRFSSSKCLGFTCACNDAALTLRMWPTARHSESRCRRPMAFGSVFMADSLATSGLINERILH